MPPVAGYPSAFPRSFMSGTSRTVRMLDVAAVLWVATWVVLGVVIGFEVRNLRQLSDTVVKAGSAVEQTGQALDPLRRVPFVGPSIDRVQRQIESAGRNAEQSGRESRRSIDTLSVLLAIAVILIPTVPLVAVYGPLRMSWIRDVRAVRRSVARWGTEPLFVEFLARRAVQHLPYHRLREISTNPWRDLEAGRHLDLAEAELRRLGLQTSLSPSTSRPAA